jgi:hypothetical protein
VWIFSPAQSILAHHEDDVCVLSFLTGIRGIYHERQYILGAATLMTNFRDMAIKVISLPSIVSQFPENEKKLNHQIICGKIPSTLRLHISPKIRLTPNLTKYINISEVGPQNGYGHLMWVNVLMYNMWCLFVRCQ